MKQLFMMMLLALVTTPLAAQEDSESDDPIRDRFIEKAVNGLRASFRDQANLRLDDVQRYLEVDESKLRKARILIKGVAKKNTENIESRIVKYLEGLWRQDRISGAESFSVNGTFYLMDPDQELELKEGEVPVPEVRVILDLFQSSMRVRYKNGSSGYGLGRRMDKLEEMDFWKLAFKPLEEESVKRYLEFEQARVRRNAVRGLMSLLEYELDLTDEQSEKLAVLLQDKIKTDSDGTLDKIYQQFINNRDLFDLEPDFLSAAQLAKWQLMKVSARKPSWE